MSTSFQLRQTLNNIPRSIKDADFPLSRIDLKPFERIGIQKGIPLFDTTCDITTGKPIKAKNNRSKLISLDDIGLATVRFDTLDFSRGCEGGCTHCLKNAFPFPKDARTILFEDLIRFTNGFKTLSERFGFNVLNGNKYLNIIDDSNPTDLIIKGLTRQHSVAEAIKLTFESLRLPILFVTSGWNQKSKFAQNSAEEIAKEFKQNPQSLKSFEVSVNPFFGIMENSRTALENGELAKANSLRELYTDRIANTLLTFFDLFKGEKPQGKLIYRHANNFKGNDLVGEEATKQLYLEIYEKLKNTLGDTIKEAPTLAPELVTKFDKSHLIEPSGRGRRYFPYEYNLRLQTELISEVKNWSRKSAEEKRQFLKDFSIKCVDINGRVYSTFPASNVKSENMPIELTVPTNIRFNYINNKEIEPVFSDIELI